MTTRAYKGIRWGILGPGRIAQTFAKAMSSVESGSIAVVHSSQLPRAQLFADQFNIPNATTDLSFFFNEYAIDAVYIAYPHSMHADAINLCLENNKHVLCEKPLTTSAEQAQLLIDQARDKESLLMEALWTRFLSTWQAVKAQLDGGAIGEIKELRSSFGFHTPFDPNDRLFNPELAGGAIWDLGIYPIAMSQFVVPIKPSKIEAIIHRGQSNVDEHTKVMMEYPNGIRSTFEVSLHEVLQNEFIIHGSKGTITVHDPFWGASSHTLANSSGAQETLNAHEINGFEYQIRHINEQINEGEIESPIVPWSDTMAFQEIMDEILSQ